MLHDENLAFQEYIHRSGTPDGFGDPGVDKNQWEALGWQDPFGLPQSNTTDPRSKWELGPTDNQLLNLAPNSGVTPGEGWGGGGNYPDVFDSGAGSGDEGHANPETSRVNPQ